MPRIADRSEIRSILERDRPWAVYALGDLDPGFFERTEWLRPAAGSAALILVYRGVSPPVLYALGSPGDLAPLLDEIEDPEVSLAIRPEVLPLLEARWRIADLKPMARMLLQVPSFQSYRSCFEPPSSPAPVRLRPHHLDALQGLYADGIPSGEAPDFFSPAMLESGVFYGLFEGAELVAAAGTHLVSTAESVAAVGNVYTRRDRRGRGFGAAVTAAVTGKLLRMRIRTIALNAARDSPAARVYERIGYRFYCPFFEGLGSPRESTNSRISF